MEQSQLLAHCGSSKITREELKVIPTPAGSATYQPVPHFEIVGALVETLSYRQISVVREEYAVSSDGMKMFGVLDLETTFDGCRFSVGVRNSNDKSMRLALTVGYRVLVCDNMAFHGDFTPVLAKHTKHLSLVDILAIGGDRMQRNFEPMRKQVEARKGARLPDETAKLVIYWAFVECELDVPKHLASRVHDLYFNPQVDEFAPRTTWSLSNAFTSAFKELEAIPQFRATAKLGAFLESVRAACACRSTNHGGRECEQQTHFSPTFVNPRNVTEEDVVDGLVEVYGRNAGGGSVLLEPGFSTRVAMGADSKQPEPTQ